MVEDIKDISNFVATKIDCIQGAGGNTSVKVDATTMLIKASGKTLLDVVAVDAYVKVDYTKIKEALNDETITITNDEDVKKINEAVNAFTLPLENSNALLKASMETSFHCLYNTYVLHTHNVYANIFLCSNQFGVLENAFYETDEYEVALLNDYYTPGAELSWHLYNNYRFEAAMPNVTFLPNHGVIYSHHNKEQLYKMYADVQTKLLQLLQLQEKDYPTYTLKPDNDALQLECNFLQNIFFTNDWQLIFTDLLFPDQAIYIKTTDFSFEDKTAKIYLDAATQTAYFNTSKKEAATIVEIAIAYFFITIEIQKRNYEPLTINYDWNKLTNMKSEKFRKSMLDT